MLATSIVGAAAPLTHVGETCVRASPLTACVTVSDVRRTVLCCATPSRLRVAPSDTSICTVHWLGAGTDTSQRPLLTCAAVPGASLGIVASECCCCCCGGACTSMLAETDEMGAQLTGATASWACATSDVGAGPPFALCASSTHTARCFTSVLGIMGSEPHALPSEPLGQAKAACASV